MCGKTASLQESVLEAILNELQSLLVTLLGVNSHNRIEIYIEITNFSCMKSIIVIEY